MTVSLINGLLIFKEHMFYASKLMEITIADRNIRKIIKNKMAEKIFYKNSKIKRYTRMSRLNRDREFYNSLH